MRSTQWKGLVLRWEKVGVACSEEYTVEGVCIEMGESGSGL